MFRRFRHRRVDEATRLSHRETFLTKGDFIWPVFLVEGAGRREPVSTMPGVSRFSVDVFLQEVAPLREEGLNSVLLFGAPDEKGIEHAYDPEGLIPRAVREIKRGFPALEVLTDVCLCSYTQDGHCHVGDNDETCLILARVAVAHARAGADAVAPSDMMDGRVFHIRRALKAEGLENTKIVSYAAKFASSFYGPFRDAADCAPKSGDRKTYQMDYANGREALEEIAADVEEGADAVIVKPALAYLDVIARAREKFSVPLYAYNVSGEYSMLLKAVETGLASADVIEESLVAIKRAGADRIISYSTPRVLAKLK